MAQEDQNESSQISHETITSFDVEGRSVDVDLRNVRKLFADAEKYNEQFSMGAMMARAMFSITEIRDYQDIPTTNIAGEKGNQELSAFFLMSAHKNLLEDVGLSLESVDGSVTMFGPDGQASEGKTRISVREYNRFNNFLGSLSPEQVSDQGL